ncbi:metallophosphoesterase [Candidatus Hodarchaeum mangrovi]
MKKIKILHLFLQYNFNITEEALEYLEEISISEKALNVILLKLPPELPVVDLSILKTYTIPEFFPETPLSQASIEESVQKQEIKPEDAIEDLIPKSVKIPVKARIKIKQDIPEKLSKKPDSNIFQIMFQDRYKKLRGIVEERIDKTKILSRDIPLDKRNQLKEGIIIGMVEDTGVLSTNRFVIQLEDSEYPFHTRCVMVEDSPSFPNYRSILRDAVVGVLGVLPKNYKEGPLTAFWGKDIIRPGFETHGFSSSNSKQRVLIISDIHYGSKTFSKGTFTRFIRLLSLENIKSTLQNIMENVSTIIIVGDLVEGVGRYPAQKDELSILSIEAQYEQLAQEFEKLPTYYDIIVIPGEHDATQIGLPQPAVNKKFASPLLKLPQIRSHGNPLRITIEDVNFLLMHGQGLDNLFQNHLKLDPGEVQEGIQNLLEYRHLGMEYGTFYPLVPYPEDYLVIDQVPEIMVTGHFHQASYNEYKGVKILTTGSFQKGPSSKKDSSLGIFYFVELGNGKVSQIDLKTID